MFPETNSRLLIDGSHMRTSDLDYLIIREAVLSHGFGAEMSREDWRVYEAAACDYPENVSGLTPDECEALQWLSEAAMTHMSDWSGGFAAYFIEDSCLWVEFDLDQTVEG